MKLDATFSREVKKTANGDGSDGHKRQFASTLRSVRRTLSTPKVMEIFTDCIKEYGRVPVAIYAAVTIKERADRLEYSSIRWANEVLSLWTNKPYNIAQFAIDDDLHPTRVEEQRYAGSLISATTIEA